MKPRCGALSIGLLTLILLAGCTRFKAAQDVPDAASLIEYLEEEGIAADYQGFVKQPVFTQAGGEYKLIGSEVLQIYEYEFEERARDDLTNLNTRHLGRRDVQIYHRGTLVVVFFGQNTNVKLALANVLGSQLV